MTRSSVKELISFSEKDSNLKGYLNTKVRDLPKWVEYSMGKDMYREFLNKPFLDYMTFMFDREPLLGLYLTFDGDEVLGWVAYVNEEWNNMISGVRFGSFRSGETETDRTKNLRFMQDIRRTFEKKIHGGVSVSFMADRDCPFNRHYYNYIKEAGGGDVIDYGGRYLNFTIKEPIPGEPEKKYVWRSLYTENEAEELYDALKSPVGLEDGELLMWRIYKDDTFKRALETASDKDDVRPEIVHCIKSLLIAIDDTEFQFDNPWNGEAVRWMRKAISCGED